MRLAVGRLALASVPLETTWTGQVETLTLTATASMLRKCIGDEFSGYDGKATPS